MDCATFKSCDKRILMSRATLITGGPLYYDQVGLLNSSEHAIFVKNKDSCNCILHIRPFRYKKQIPRPVIEIPLSFFNSLPNTSFYCALVKSITRYLTSLVYKLGSASQLRINKLGNTWYTHNTNQVPSLYFVQLHHVQRLYNVK